MVIVRAGRYLYYFNLKNDNCYKRTKESNDHSGTLEVYLNLLSSSDPLCQGTIEGEMPYKWVNSCREIVNYKDGVFHDPEITDLWFTICNYLNKNEMKVLLNKYRENPQETCFSVDDAILSIPTNRMFVIADDLKRDRISALSQIQIEWISSIINNKLYKEDLDYLLF